MSRLEPKARLRDPHTPSPTAHTGKRKNPLGLRLDTISPSQDGDDMLPLSSSPTRSYNAPLFVPAALPLRQPLSLNLLQMVLNAFNHANTGATQVKVEFDAGNNIHIILSRNRRFLLSRGRALGQGSFGNVYTYSVTEPNIIPSTTFNLAAKFYRQDESDGACEQETEAQKHLRACGDHPNIIKLFGHIALTARTGILFLEQWPLSLAEFIEHNTEKNYVELQQMVGGIANALLYLSRRKLLHLDIKATNILLTDKGEAILTDFGVSRTLNDYAAKSPLIGTFKNLSPDVFDDQTEPTSSPPDFDHYQKQTDLWAFGLVIKEMLGLQPPTIVAENQTRDAEEEPSEIERHAAYADWARDYTQIYHSYLEQDQKLSGTRPRNSHFGQLNSLANCLLAPLAYRPAIDTLFKDGIFDKQKNWQAALQTIIETIKAESATAGLCIRF